MPQAGGPTGQAQAGLPDPALLAQIEKVRDRVHGAFGQVVLSMTVLPRYRNLPVADLVQLVLDPLIRDRVAIAQSAPADGKGVQATAGIAIWASVSEEVDARIREQIVAGVFPIRLKAEDWTSGTINWLFDVIAPNPRLAASVIANFKQVVRQGDLRIHPLVTRLVDPEMLKKMGAVQMRRTTDNGPAEGGAADG